MEFFGDVKTACGLQVLNDYLEERSYICGHAPSEVDVEVFSALTKAPEETFLHALRWYNHIKSLGIEFKLTLQDGLTSPTILPMKEENECQETTKGSETLMEAISNSEVKNEELKCGDSDHGFDFFGSEDVEDQEAARAREERLQAYAEKKLRKPGTTAKSSVMLDVKPRNDGTDIKAMEEHVRSIKVDGLQWGASKLNPLASGVNKLSILCTVEDDKVSIDNLIHKIRDFADTVQSVDIAAFNEI
ncbi:elongation factor 1-beta-like [Panulirus ornatus]|uniref:elongation factor 1-beta-like n=1 Tax=Panulirus ornatus TaxID=150431 RepID=UPI003A84E793